MELIKSDPCFFGVDLSNDRYQVSFELTNCCNLECKHCFNQSNKDAHNGLSRDDIFTLIDELAEIEVNNVYITGGEPTCYQYFCDVVKYFNKNNIEVILATNAYYIFPYIDCIKDNISTNAGVFVSLDGFNEIHDEFRNKKGAFQKTVENIQLLVKNNIMVRISSVAWKKNITQIEEMIKLSKSLGAYQIHFTIPIKVGRAGENDIEADESYNNIVNIIETASKKHSTELFQVALKRNRLLDEKSKDCKAGIKILHISSDGLISPCSWLVKSDDEHCYSLKWEKGNLKNCIAKIQSFSDIIKSRKKIYGYTGCPAMARIFKNDIWANDPLNELLTHDREI